MEKIKVFLATAFNVIFIFIFLVAFRVIPGMGELVSRDRAVNALSAEGWKDIEVTAKHGFFPHIVGGCGEDDEVGFETTGINPAGQRSTAIVCCGLAVKGCTIRH